MPSTREHHCGYCGKSLPTIAGVKKHVAKRPECRERWEAMVSRTEDVSVFDEDQDNYDDDQRTMQEKPMPFSEPRSPGPTPDAMEDWEPPSLPRTRSLSAGESEPPKRSKRGVQMEDVTDEEELEPGRFFESFEGAGGVLRENPSPFEDYQRKRQENGEHTYSPFDDEEEWDLAAWMMKNLGQTRMDEFLKLPIVRQCPALIGKQVELTNDP